MNIFDQLKPEQKRKGKRALVRAVDFIELFFPNPSFFPMKGHIPEKITLGPYQKNVIDTIQFGYPLSRFKFGEVEETPDGVIWITRRQVGKCVHPDTKIHLSNGSLKKASELQSGDSLITYTGKSFVKSEPITVWDNGEKKSVRITTHSGRVIKCTENHPFLTPNGYVKAKNLSSQERIGMARHIKNTGKEILTDEEIIFIGYMIAEGHMRNRNGRRELTFTNTDDDIVREFLSCVDNYTKFSKCQYRILGKRLKNLIEDVGLFNKKSGEKFIPKVIFRSKDKQIQLFLSALINGDGYVQEKKNGTIQIEYCSKSKRLIKELSLLFTRIGMFAHLFTKHNKKYDSDFYYLRFSSSIDIKNAQKYLSLCDRKQRILNKADPQGYDHIDTFPLQTQIKEYIKNKEDMYLKDLGFGIRNEYALSPNKLDRILEQIPEYYVDTKIFWDKIKEIKSIGVQPSIGISVPKHHTHITDGFITHNSWSCADSAAALTILGSNILEGSGGKVSKIGMIAASEGQAQELIDKAKWSLQNSPFSKYVDEVKMMKITMKNGSYIKAHTSSPKSIRSPAYDFIFIDESRWVDEDLIFRSAIPTVTHGERWVAISTPEGPRGKLMDYYFQGLETRPIICKNCGETYNQKEFHDITFPTSPPEIGYLPEGLPKCAKCGEKNYKYGIGDFATPFLDPWKCPIINQKKLKRKLDRYGWSPGARQEWLGHIIREGSMVILQEWLDSCVKKTLRNTMTKKEKNRYIMSVDYGRHVDASVFFVSHKNSKGHIVWDYMEAISGEFDHDSDYDSIRDRIKSIAQFYTPDLIVPDATGKGDSLVEQLKDDLSRWHLHDTRIYNNKKNRPGFVFDTRTKLDLIDYMKIYLSDQQRKVWIPPRTEPGVDEFFKECIRFECEVSEKTGHVNYGTQNYHDDRVIAFALGLWGHKSEMAYMVEPQGFEYEIIDMNNQGMGYDSYGHY